MRPLIERPELHPRLRASRSPEAHLFADHCAANAHRAAAAAGIRAFSFQRAIRQNGQGLAVACS